MIRIDKIVSGKVGNIESVVHTSALFNGNVIALGDYKAGERELYTVAQPALTDEVLVVAAPEVVYDSTKVGLKDFSIPANTPARAFHFTVGDHATFTDDMISGTTVVGNFLVTDATTMKLKYTATPADVTASRFAAKVIEKTTLGYDGAAATAFRVIKS